MVQVMVHSATPTWPLTFKWPWPLRWFSSLTLMSRFCSRGLKVCVEGRLYLEFMFDDMMRIKTWHFSIRQHREVLPRSILAMHVSLTRTHTHAHTHTQTHTHRHTHTQAHPFMYNGLCSRWCFLKFFACSPMACRTPRCWINWLRTSRDVASPTPRWTIFG